MVSTASRPRKRLSPKQIRERLRTARREEARKARIARRRIERIHDQLPKQVRTIFDPLEPAFSRPIHRRFVLLALAAILTLKNTKQRKTLVVAWYGGGKRRVEVVTGIGLWYKKGRPLVELRWVFVHDLSGTHRDQYFFSTDVTMSVRSIIETYTGRWNIEISHSDYPSSNSLYRGHWVA